jgi:mannitol-1-phosphate 5-dehydrogenase
VDALSAKYKINVQALKEYSKKLIGRFENTYLQDELYRVGRDPMRKLSFNDRLITPLRMCNELDIDCKNILCGIAAGFLFDYIDDDKAQEIQNRIKNYGIKNTISFVSGLAKEDAFVGKLADKYEELKNMLTR